MSRSLWMGDLDPHMDEAFIARIFHDISLPVSVKVIRRKDTGMPAGYCFIEFATDSEAERVLKLINGTHIPGVTPPKRFRLNRSQAGKLWDIGPSYSIFVGDLDLSVTDDKLEDFFMSKYRSVKGAKIVYEDGSVSRGYGFVRFSSELEQKRALSEMQGARGLGSKPIRVSVATPKGKVPESPSAANMDANQYNQQWMKQYADQYQYYQQYYSNYYNNYPQTGYYQQPTTTVAPSSVPQSSTQYYSSAKHYLTTRNLPPQDKLEDPSEVIEIDEENEKFFIEQTALIDQLGAHWSGIDSLTSKLREATAT